MQRKTRFSLHFRVHGKFGEAKVTKKLRAKQKNLFFFCRDGIISMPKAAKLRILQKKH